MNLLDAAIKQIYKYVDARIDDARPFRAIVTGQSGGMVQIRRLYATSGETALRARVVGFDLATNDEVLCVPMADGLPLVVGKIQRASAVSQGLSAGLTSLNTPYTEDVTISNSAVTASTTDTANYSVNVQNLSFDLPTGTWNVYAWGGGLYAHSSDNGIVRVHLQVGSDAGTALTMACRQDTGRSYIGMANASIGETGSIEIRQEYRPNASGTAYAGGGWLMAVAFRTS